MEGTLIKAEVISAPSSSLRACCLYCTVTRVLEVIYVSLSAYGTVPRISTRLCVPSITGAAGHQLWWEPLYHGRGQCCKSGPLVSFFFGEPLLDIDQADRARWANQFLPLGIWNWGQEGSTGLGFSIAAHPSSGLQAEGRRKQGTERGWPPRG